MFLANSNKHLNANLDQSKPGKFNCRNASYTIIAAELDKFNERTSPVMGILMQVSGLAAINSGGSPLVSLPKPKIFILECKIAIVVLRLRGCVEKATLRILFLNLCE